MLGPNGEEERYRNFLRSLHPRDSGRGRGVGGRRCLSSCSCVFWSEASIPHFSPKGHHLSSSADIRWRQKVNLKATLSFRIVRRLYANGLI